MSIATLGEVLDFWFGNDPQPGDRMALWFGKSTATDAAIRERFLTTQQAAARGELDGWLRTPDGVLALVVVLDQFSRNLYRDSPLAFVSDDRARAYAHVALQRGDDQAMRPEQRLFLYLPFEHSENLDDQRRSVRLFAAIADAPGMDAVFDYALRHYAVIARFGRFPHRNAALGRASTDAEQTFLLEPGSRF